MNRLTFVCEDGTILFHPEWLQEDEGFTITELAKGGRFDDLEQIAEALVNVEQRLEKYLDTNLIPEQLLEIDKMYAEKCREVAELRAELKAYKDTGMTAEDTLDMIACMDKEDGYGPEEEIADLLELMRYRKAIGELEDKSERYHYLWHSLNDNSPYNAGRADAMRKAINILKGGAEDETD